MFLPSSQVMHKLHNGVYKYVSPSQKLLLLSFIAKLNTKAMTLFSISYFHSGSAWAVVRRLRGIG